MAFKKGDQVRVVHPTGFNSTGIVTKSYKHPYNNAQMYGVKFNSPIPGTRKKQDSFHEDFVHPMPSASAVKAGRARVKARNHGMIPRSNRRA